eukprot:11322475-Ditylum_brightwellii.AAC.1
MDLAMYLSKTGATHTATPNHLGTYNPTIRNTTGRVLQNRRETAHSDIVNMHLTEKAVTQTSKNQLIEDLKR